MRLPDAE
jgi:hypothetical protein